MILLESFSIVIDKSGNIKVIKSNEHYDYILKRFDMRSNCKIVVCPLNNTISRNIIMIDLNVLTALVM